MDTLTQVERLIELAIIQRSELRRLVEELPQLKAHLSEEIERTFEETEPQLRAELEEWTTKQTADKTAALGVALEAKIADLAKSLEVSTQARYNAIIAEREENARLAAQAEAKIAEHAASLPYAVKEIVTAELARFPRAGEIDQLRKEFQEPRGLNPRGKWVAGESYNKLDLVTINGDSYVSNIDGNTEKPSRSAANWTLNAARGNSGGGGGITALNDLLGNPSTGDIVGSEGNNYVKKTLTAGTGVDIVETPTSITIDATEAQELMTATVTNAESVAITRGQVVYLFAATGNRASVKLAYNTSDATSAKTFGVVSDDSIAAGGVGQITCIGVVDKLMLGSFNEGDTVYLGATAGSITNVKPYAPNHLVYVGIVERANNGNGELYVRIQNGYELDEIHDVQINNPRQAGQTLIYDATNALWKNARLTAGVGVSITNADSSITISADGGVNYQGTWNASTNTPTLTSSVGTKGFYYVVSVAGSTNLNGITDWQVGDWAIFNGSAWQKVDTTDQVSSVFGRTGAVVGVSTDYSAVGITNTAIGASNPSTGAFTTLSATGNLTVSGTGISSVAGTIAGYNQTVAWDGGPNTTNPAFAIGTGAGTTRDLFAFGNGSRIGLLRGYHDGGGTVEWNFGRYITGTFNSYFKISGSSATNGAASITGTTDSTSTTTGALVVTGGVGVGGAVNAGGNVSIKATTNSGRATLLVQTDNSDPAGVNAFSGSVSGALLDDAQGYGTVLFRPAARPSASFPADGALYLYTSKFNGSIYAHTLAATISDTNTTLAGNLTVSGGTITGGTSGLSLASGGTNQNITLTPSGTGLLRVTCSRATAYSSSLTGDVVIYNPDQTDNGYSSLAFGTRTSAGGVVDTGSAIASITTNHIGASFATQLAFLTRNGSGTLVEAGRFTNGGNFILGTTTDIGGASGGVSAKTLRLSINSTNTNYADFGPVGSAGTTADYTKLQGWSDTAVAARDIAINPSGRNVLLASTGGLVSVLGTTASTSTTTGALVVSGGVGVAGAVNAGGNLTVSGDVTLGDYVGDADVVIAAQSTGVGYLRWRPTASGTNAYGFSIAYDNPNSKLSFLRHEFSTAGTEWLSVARSTGNAMFAGNLSVNGTAFSWSVPAIDMSSGASIYANGNSIGLITNARYNLGSGGWLYKNTAASAMLEMSATGIVFQTVSSGTAGALISSFTNRLNLTATAADFSGITTDSSSTTTGALIVGGGVGIAKAAYIGGVLSQGGASLSGTAAAGFKLSVGPQITIYSDASAANSATGGANAPTYGGGKFSGWSAGGTRGVWAYSSDGNSYVTSGTSGAVVFGSFDVAPHTNTAANFTQYGYWSSSGVHGNAGAGLSVKGTTTNDSAAAGYVGEYVSSSVASSSAVSLTTATAANITSISLTAGDWDVEANIFFTQQAGTTSTYLISGLNSTSATIPSNNDGGRFNLVGFAGDAADATSKPSRRYSLNATTTIYVVAQAGFSGGTCSAFGQLFARRVR